MSIKDIRLFGDPVLRTPAAEVTDFDKQLRTLVKDLQDTMLDAPGAGLAAPQIGVGLRVFTYWVDGVLGHLVNPVARPLRRGAGRPRGLPQHPRPHLRHEARALGRRQGPEHVGRAGRARGHGAARPLRPARDRPPRRHPLRRPLDPEARREAMRAIREAEWFADNPPEVRISPHSTFGRAM